MNVTPAKTANVSSCYIFLFSRVSTATRLSLNTLQRLPQPLPCTLLFFCLCCSLQTTIPHYPYLCFLSTTITHTLLFFWIFSSSHSLYPSTLSSCCPDSFLLLLCHLSTFALILLLSANLPNTVTASPLSLYATLLFPLRPLPTPVIIFPHYFLPIPFFNFPESPLFYVPFPHYITSYFKNSSSLISIHHLGISIPQSLPVTLHTSYHRLFDVSLPRAYIWTLTLHPIPSFLLSSS